MEKTRLIEEQIRFAVDPTGEQTDVVDFFADTNYPKTSLTRSSQFKEKEWTTHSEIVNEYRQHLIDMKDALELLVPRGWAPFSMDADAINQAVDLVRAGKEEEADDLLADQWFGEGRWRTVRVHSRVTALGAGERQPSYNQIFRERARLVRKAQDHHEAGHYEASILLIQSQTEGIVMDVANGKKFYTKTNQKADLVDPSKLVSIEACLAALQTLYGQSITETLSEGSFSRHAIAHGRELAYDTRVNSAKYWSVFDALVDWARPMAAAVARQLREESELANVGSQGVDDRGRRIDDREFFQTKGVLGKLLASAAGWKAKSGAFPRDPIGVLVGNRDFIAAGLPANHGIQFQLSSDGQFAWFWRETVSGWVLGAATGIISQGYGEWFYAGIQHPTASPSDSPEFWGEVFVRPPDWN